MRFTTPSFVSTALVASVCATGALAAPALDTHQLIYPSAAPSGLEALTFGLSAKLSSAFNGFLSHLSQPVATFEDEGKTIWDVINDSDEFSQLAHILNYSSDATKDILKKKQDLTLFAPLNWHHHRDGGHDDKEAFQDTSFGPASIQQWDNIQKQIADYERDFSVAATQHDDDKDKKHRRELIRHLIDATALYHLVRSDTVLDAKAIADNSSVATWLNTGKSHPNNAGTDWRVRTGKSLLPLPAVYLNFYSRVVKPDIRTKNGLIHGIKYPLVLPPDVLQSLFYGQTTSSTTTSALQKAHVAKYLTYRPGHSHHHHGHGKAAGLIDAWHHESNDTKHFDGVPAETIFVPTNLAWSRLPFIFRAYLFSPWGTELLQKIFMLHSLPSDIVYADFVHHVSHRGKAAPEAVHTTVGHANKTSYTFDSVLPKINGTKGEFETVDVDVYRYYLLPGNKGPLQTRIVAQNVSVILQDIPASNGVFHYVDKFFMPKGHPHKGVWAEVAAAAEQAGFGSVDLIAEAQAGKCASLASANNKQANSQPSNSPSNSVKTPFLTGVHHPTNDSASATSIPLLNFNNTTTNHSTPSAAAAVKPISLRAHLEAAISNPSSTSAQANLLKQLQTTLAAIRPSSHSHAVATPPSSTVHSTTPAQQHTFARVPSITPAAVASALAAAAAGRRHTLPSTPVANSAAAITTSHVTKAQTQRLEQIRYYQQLIAQLNATMPASADSSVPTLPFEARPMDSVKTDGTGFNAAAFGLNPMSADDPSWIGHGFQAQAADDFLSSPEWTDPSPALTDSMSFEIDSCGPSPLLPLDSYEDDLGVPGIAGAPLFPPQDGYASSNVSPLELAHHDFGASTVGDFGAPEMGSDFTLFPETKPVRLPIEMAFSKLNKPAAGTGASAEDPAMTLLRALSSAALSNSSSTASVAVTNTTTSMASSTPALTASPLAFTSMAAPLAPAPASTASAPALAPAPPSSESSRPALERRSSSMSSSSSSTKAATTDPRGTKRRVDSIDLLPLDAPIQKRTYYAVSATSRRDTAPAAEVDEFAEEEAAIRREKDPRVAKRLSNTLAARRSRHRKAEELRLLHEKIEALSGEVESWKRRCELAEKERDDARALLS